MNAQSKQAILSLVNSCRDAMACSVDGEGYPNVKSMFVRSREGFGTFWFSTNTSAIRTALWQQNPKACIYFVDPADFHGMMLTGNMAVLTDEGTKQRFWEAGDDMYYPLGPTDPDYCILRFTAEKGNYYHGLQKCLFDVAELEG